MSTLIRFIYKNTFMDKCVVAFFKIFIIIVPLYVGLYTNAYLSVDFCKSLFLYSTALGYDMVVRYLKIIEDNERAPLLYVITVLITVTSVALCSVSIVGVFNNDLLQDYVENQNLKTAIIICILLQAAWYAIETVALFICEFAKRLLKEKSVEISSFCSRKYSNKHTI